METVQLGFQAFALFTQAQAYALSSFSLEVGAFAPWGTPPAVVGTTIVRSSDLSSELTNEQTNHPSTKFPVRKKEQTYFYQILR